MKRRLVEPPGWSQPAPATAGPRCPLCGRELLPGPSSDEHHWIPRSHGGKVVARLHRICHHKIHATLCESELARFYHTPERLQAHPDIARFIAWVRHKPPQWMDTSRWSAERRGK
jgi:hypothetical protein